MSFIPGMSAVVDAGGPFYPPVESISVAAYSAESSTIAWPVDRAKGDVAI